MNTTIAADQYSPSEGEGFVRAETIHEAVALVPAASRCGLAG